jgi:uncharacterized protein (UPF0332 family)
MRWHEFLDTAERLVKGTTEGDWRSGASRAYYAVFHYFCELFLSEGVDLGQGGQAHSNLYVGLNNCGVPSAIPIATDVDRLRSTRGKADYNLAVHFSQSRADGSVQRAKAIVSDFQSLLNTIPLAQIVAGAKSYLQSIGRIP